VSEIGWEPTVGPLPSFMARKLTSGSLSFFAYFSGLDFSLDSLSIWRAKFIS